MNKSLYLILLSQLLTSLILGQQFSFHSSSPFGIELAKEDGSRSAQKIMFFDFDGDDDLDLFLIGIDVIDPDFEQGWESITYFIEMQENVGDTWNPEFAERKEVFSDFPFPLGYFFPSVGDLNGDKKADFIVSAEVDFIGNRTLTYIKSQNDETFEVIRMNTFDLWDFVPESILIPELVDLDSDGDLDLLMSGLNPDFAEEFGPDIPIYFYAKNEGTESEPDFIGWYDNPYGLEPNVNMEILCGGDIDNDGDMDLLGTALLIPADSVNVIYVHLNQASPGGRPVFNNILESPFGLPTMEGETQFSFPVLADINGDGDSDLFVFAGNGNLNFYENNLCTAEVTETQVSICEGESVSIGGTEFSIEGTYTVRLLGNDRCDSTVLLTLEVNPVQSSSITASICEGQNYSVGAESFSESGMYTVTLTSENGCDSIVILQLNVEELIVPITVFENSIIVLQSAATYQWINCDTGENIPGANGQSYIPTVSGNYSVLITLADGCTGTSECVEIIETGTDEDSVSNAVSVYPNPTDGLIYIKNESEYPISSARISTVSGKQIQSFNLSGKNTLDLSFLDKGVYLIKFELNNTELTKKIIIE
ncbi:MAG: T9SS type A sorting domain-containing protein [Saprospiraceae bacterium]|nr:T9SS type A sorting domain-containing protein [Saprospiraceae bacterium]